ncbi:putative metal-binding motif-containing protein, partial [Patescibacteria group bacterium]
WLLVGPMERPDRYRQRVRFDGWVQVLSSWGLFYSPTNPPGSLADDGVLSDYPIKNSWAKFRDGTLVKQVNDATVFVISDQVAMPVENWSTFLFFGYSAETIITVDNQFVSLIQERVGSCMTDSFCLTHDLAEQCGINLGAEPPDDVFTEAEGESEEVVFEEVWVDEEELAEEGLVEFEETELEPEEDDFEPEEEFLAELEESTGPFDLDYDGFSDLIDCNDNNSSIHPGANEICGDNLDQDCDGYDLPCEQVHDHRLILRWTTPFEQNAERITLSGEYTMADGSYGFFWRDLIEVTYQSFIELELVGVAHADSLRFSVEYVDAFNQVSWSCIGPFPPGTMQGQVEAWVNELEIEVVPADDPTSDGCGLILIIP